MKPIDESINPLPWLAMAVFVIGAIAFALIDRLWKTATAIFRLVAQAMLWLLGLPTAISRGTKKKTLVSPDAL